MSVGFGILFYLISKTGDDQIKTLYDLKEIPSYVSDKLQTNQNLKELVAEIEEGHSKMSNGNVSKEFVKNIQEKTSLLQSNFSFFEKVKLGFSKIKADLAEADYIWVLLSVVAALISHWIRAMRWNLLIEPLGYKPRTLNTFFAVMIGYVANLVVPRMGEVSRCAALGKSEGIPTDRLIGTIIIERGVDLISLLVLTALTFILQLDIIGDFFGTLAEDKGVNLLSPRYLGMAIVIIFSIFLIAKYGPKMLLQSLQGTSMYFKITRLIAGLMAGLKSISKMKSKRTFILQTIMIWICYYSMIYLVFPSYTPTANLGPLAGLSALVIGSFGMVAPVQGGIGAYHWCLQTCLELYHIPARDGITLAFIVHTAQTLIVIVGGVLSLVLLPIFTKKKNLNISKYG